MHNPSTKWLRYLNTASQVLCQTVKEVVPAWVKSLYRRRQEVSTKAYFTSLSSALTEADEIVQEWQMSEVGFRALKKQKSVFFWLEELVLT